MRLIFTRHGETEWNLAGRIQGFQNSPLTENGRGQAARLRARLALIPLNGAFTSPSGRALETTEILVGRRALPVTTDDRLKEISLGAFEGLTFEQVFKQYPEHAIHFKKKPERLAPPGGETHAQVRARCVNFLNEVCKLEGTYLAVAHAMTLRAMYLAMKGMDVSEILGTPKTPGCCYCEAEYENGRWNVISFGENWHAAPGFGEGLWYHGSPEAITRLNAGSTITPFANLARAFSHKPARMSISDEGEIEHDGQMPGTLYRVEGVTMDDVYQHPRTALCRAAEWITRRALPLIPAPEETNPSEAGRSLDPLP